MAEIEFDPTAQPVVPKDAASLLLLRGSHGSEGIEVLMVKRHSRSVFAGGMFVFPGGELDEEDCHPSWGGLLRRPLPGELEKLCSDGTSPEKALGLMVAGIRELFEETGILLAGGNAEEALRSLGRKDALLREYRAGMCEGRLRFRDVVRELGIDLALDRLVFFAHWITPEISPIRYDTRFFLAPAPEGQTPRHDRAEVTTCQWMRPHEALRMCGEGRFPLLPPTMANLHALTEFRNVEEALESARERDVPTVLPRFGA